MPALRKVRLLGVQRYARSSYLLPLSRASLRPAYKRGTRPVTPPQRPPRGDEYSLLPSPTDVLKWSAVVFAVALEVLIVISIVLAMFGVYG